MEDELYFCALVDMDLMKHPNDLKLQEVRKLPKTFSVPEIPEVFTRLNVLMKKHFIPDEYMPKVWDIMSIYQNDCYINQACYDALQKQHRTLSN